jgi:hypothetical protein
MNTSNTSSSRNNRHSNNTNTNTNININTNSSNNDTQTQQLYQIFNMYYNIYVSHLNTINQTNQNISEIRNTMNVILDNIINSGYRRPSSNSSSRGSRQSVNIPTATSYTNRTTAPNYYFTFPYRGDSFLSEISGLVQPRYTQRTNGSIPRTNGSIPRTNGSIPRTNGSIPRTNGSISNSALVNFINSRLLDSFMEPVAVVPTREQIRAASTIIRFGDIANPINSECPISRETFDSGDEVTQLFCGHIFSTDDINTWFSSHVGCPVCRVDIREFGTTSSSLNRNGGLDIEEGEVIEGIQTQDETIQEQQIEEQPIEEEQIEEQQVNRQRNIQRNNRGRLNSQNDRDQYIRRLLEYFVEGTDTNTNTVLRSQEIQTPGQTPRQTPRQRQTNTDTETEIEWRFLGTDPSGNGLVFETFIDEFLLRGRN